jgi:DNA-binding transcriptional regulator YiaG
MNDTDRSKTCSTCGGSTTHRGYVHVEKVGKYKVKDATSFAMQCTKEDCGEVELTLNELAGYQRRAAALVLREAPEVDGAVVKYARRALGMKQVDLAARIGCASETLSRWETGVAPIPRAEQLAIVAILDGVELAGGLDGYLEQDHARTSKTFEVPPRRACGG